MYAADAPRIVLIIDVWHPDLSAQEVSSDLGTVWSTASSVTLAVVGVAMRFSKLCVQWRATTVTCVFVSMCHA